MVNTIGKRKYTIHIIYYSLSLYSIYAYPTEPLHSVEPLNIFMFIAFPCLSAQTERPVSEMMTRRLGFNTPEVSSVESRKS